MAVALIKCGLPLLLLVLHSFAKNCAWASQWPVKPPSQRHLPRAQTQGMPGEIKQPTTAHTFANSIEPLGNRSNSLQIPPTSESVGLLKKTCSFIQLPSGFVVIVKVMDLCPLGQAFPLLFSGPGRGPGGCARIGALTTISGSGACQRYLFAWPQPWHGGKGLDLITCILRSIEAETPGFKRWGLCFGG